MHAIGGESVSSQGFSDRAMSTKKFSWVVIGLSANLCLLIAITNYVVNPYSQYSTKVIAPLVQTSRATKVALMQRHDHAPEGLILGSSRVLKVEPAYLRQKLGLEFFNARVRR